MEKMAFFRAFVPSPRDAILSFVLGVILGRLATLVMQKRTEIYRQELEDELRKTYLCGHSLADMIRVDFFDRFCTYNNEGFCYTFSAIMMIALRRFRRTRLVRGYIELPDYETNHSWVEIKICGRWWVIDSNLDGGISMSRRTYHKCLHPRILATYSYQEFWDDPWAVQFYERLRKPETSRIFLQIYQRYTPTVNSIKIPEIGNGEIELPDDNLSYTIFPPEYGFRFSQRIVNELMARPTRRSPKRHTLRRLDNLYRLMGYKSS